MARETLVTARHVGLCSSLFCAALLLLSCVREPCQKLTTTTPQTEEEAFLEGDAPPRPRCDPANSSCGPAPRSVREDACYRPSAKRERLPPREKSEPHVPSRYDCTHDGECMINGCGNVCTSYKMGTFETNCIGYEWLDAADFCGCIEGECSFFRQ